ncbi:MAG: hypothetical protein ACI4SU_05270 [Anaerovoracaceae bacterium]
MDYFKFIHSGDVREHLRRINYPLSSLEAAWLVWESDLVSIKEKHTAWEEIIRTMPDCVIEERYRISKQDSLHDYLKRLMKLQKAREDAFCQNEKAVYVYSWHTRGMDGYRDDYEEVFRSYEDCLQAIRRDWPDHGLSGMKFMVIKLGFENRKLRKSAWLNSKLEIMRIEDGELPDLSEEDRVILQQGLNGLRFDFPVPFEAGDILEPYNGKAYGSQKYPFVLKEVEENLIVSGYFQSAHGGIYADHMHNYLNLEYYREDLEDEKRVLKVLSRFLKGEIDITFYSEAYRAILEEEQLRQVWPVSFEEEEMAQVGLREKAEVFYPEQLNSHVNSLAN